jgi:hypothetical protein
MVSVDLLLKNDDDDDDDGIWMMLWSIDSVVFFLLISLPPSPFLFRFVRFDHH